jgi:hypothetical protein
MSRAPMRQSLPASTQPALNPSPSQKGEQLQKKRSEHFMAAIVGLRRENITIGADDHRVIEVVDGQQRLTTLIILLKAIEQAFDINNPAQATFGADLAKLLVKPDGDALLLLQTNHDTSFYFQNYLRDGKYGKASDAKTLADRELLAAIDECVGFVKTWAASKRTVADLLALLRNRLGFLLYEIEDEGAVYTVFEVLNNRGLEVPWLDRLKSFLMGAAFELPIGNKMEGIDELHNVWRDIYACVGLRQGMRTEALRFAATLKCDDCPRRSLGEKDAVQLFQSKASTGPNITSAAHWLLDVTRAYDGIEADRRLNAVTQIAQARLLATAIKLGGHLTANEQEKLLRVWEKVSFRIYGLWGEDARTRVGAYVSLSWRIVNKILKFDEILAELQKIGQNHNITDKSMNDFLKWRRRGNDFYSDRGEELRYFFFRYEEYLARKADQNFSNEQWERIWTASTSDSIEHIWAQSKAPEEHVHRLGNLMFLPPRLNSRLQDLDPGKKVEEYRKTGLLINDELVGLLTKPWGEKAIAERESALLLWAISEWGGVDY